MGGAKMLAKKFVVDKGKEMLGNAVNKIRGKGQLNQQEDVAITHLDGSTTEVIDVVKPEPLADKEDQESLHDRLWDQVAANLTTLGEMAGVRYQVSPVEELEEKKDYDGDGEVRAVLGYLVSSIIRYNRRWVRRVMVRISCGRTFNVKYHHILKTRRES